MFTDSLQESKAYNRSLRKTIVKFIISRIFRNKLIENKEQESPEFHFEINFDTVKEFDGYFVNKNVHR